MRSDAELSQSLFIPAQFFFAFVKVEILVERRDLELSEDFLLEIFERVGRRNE